MVSPKSGRPYRIWCTRCQNLGPRTAVLHAFSHPASSPAGSKATETILVVPAPSRKGWLDCSRRCGRDLSHQLQNRWLAPSDKKLRWSGRWPRPPRALLQCPRNDGPVREKFQWCAVRARSDRRPPISVERLRHDQLGYVADDDAVLHSQVLNGRGVHHEVLGTADDEGIDIPEGESLLDAVLARSLDHG